MIRTTTAIVLAVLIAGSAAAQIQSGTINGTAKDQQGGVLPGVTATLQGVDFSRSFIADGSGEFRFLELAPGAYKLSVALSGFQTVVRENVIIEVGKSVNLPVVMRVAPLTETVTVVAPTPLLDGKQTGTATNITAPELTK